MYVFFNHVHCTLNALDFTIIIVLYVCSSMCIVCVMHAKVMLKTSVAIEKAITLTFAPFLPPC